MKQAFEICNIITKQITIATVISTIIVNKH